MANSDSGRAHAYETGSYMLLPPACSSPDTAACTAKGGTIVLMLATWRQRQSF